MRAANIEIRCDGLCEPNPGGLATYGYVLFGEQEVLHEGRGVAARGPEATNNVAEYRGAIEALAAAQGYDARQIILLSDSKLLVEQLNGNYRVRSARIQPLWSKTLSLLNSFESHQASWVPREQNEHADALSVQAYVETLEAERAERTKDVRLVYLGKGLYRANGRYTVDLVLRSCECPDFKKMNSARYKVRCKHLLRAQEEWELRSSEALQR
jgi:ribonuclease HI